MEIIVGRGRNSDINQKPNEYKVENCNRCHGREKHSAMNEHNKRTYLGWVIRESLRLEG